MGKPRKTALYFGRSIDPFCAAEPWTIHRISRDSEVEQSDGWSAPEARALYIPRKKDKAELLYIALHEALHAEFPDLAEEAVIRAAKHFVALLVYLKLV